MAYGVLKFMHLIGFFAAVAALSGLAIRQIYGHSGKDAWQKKLGLLHGLGMTLGLIGGMGMLGHLKLGFPWPLWIWLKLGIWLFLGAMPAPMRRRPEKAPTLFLLLIALVAVAAYLGIMKNI